MKFFFFLILGISLFSHSSAAFAALPNLDIGFLNPGYTAGSDIGGYINTFYNFAIGIAGALAMAMIVYGGIRYATSSGRPDAQSDAKEAIYSALFGVVLLFGSYLLLKTINPKLIDLSTNSINESPVSCPIGQTYCIGTPANTSKCVLPCPLGPNNEKQIFTSDCQVTAGGSPVCKHATINCPRTVMATSVCPGAVMLSTDLTNDPDLIIVGKRVSDGTSVSTGGNLVLAGITDNNTTYEKFYQEDEWSIPRYSVIWTYPYYERSNEDKSGAKCLIYAWKTPKGTCNPATLRCTEYKPLNKTDLNSEIKPC